MADVLATLNFSFIKLLNFKNMTEQKSIQFELDTKPEFNMPEISRRLVWQ